MHSILRTSDIYTFTMNVYAKFFSVIIFIGIQKHKATQLALHNDYLINQINDVITEKWLTITYDGCKYILDDK